MGWCLSVESHERSEGRPSPHNGVRARLSSTPAGHIELGVPKVRPGSLFPAWLEPRRRRVAKALWAVIMPAYISGTSTLEVDDLARAQGSESGVSKSTVSRICTQIDGEVEAFRNRPLDHVAGPTTCLDATQHQGQSESPHRVPRRHGGHLGHRRWQPVKSWVLMSATPKPRYSALDRFLHGGPIEIPQS